MIKLIKSIYDRKVAENEAAREQILSESRIVSEASNIVTERPDAGGWTSIFQPNDREKGMLQTTQLEMVRKAREMTRFDPNARAAITTYVNYIMGKGLSITPKSDDPMIWYTWREFWTASRNGMRMKQFEIIKRVLRDGEIFIRFFKKDETGKETGKTTIRFIDPLRIRAKGDDSEGATINNGVITNPDDVEDVKAYSIQSINDENTFETVPAAEMLHIKINVDSDQKRGESQLLSIMRMLKHYDQWIENRIILNKMRSAIVLLKKVTGSPTEVANLAATLPTARNPANESKKVNFRGGTIITAGPGVEYEMLSANINATDAKEDGRNIKLNIAAGTNMPEYVFGDASNNNFASSLIAESPFVKSIQYLQIFFEYYFGEIFRRVIQAAVDGGQLVAPNDEAFVAKLTTLRPLAEAGTVPPEKPADDAVDANDAEKPNNSADPNKPKTDPKEDARQAALQELMPNGKMEMPSEIFFGCDMDWPEIVHREMKQQVDALAVARSNGWIADSTATAALGYEYAEEVRKQRQIEEESAKQRNPLMGPSPLEAGDSASMDGELEDMLNTLSPMEQQAILKAKDPREVVRIMGRNKAKAGAGADE